MDATAVAQAGAQAGETTLECQVLDLRYAKLLRFRALKIELRTLRCEYEQLENELFGAGAL